MTQLDIFSLDGRVALIPGGGGGIGSALAEALAGAGAKVAVAGRTRDTVDATVERVRAAGSDGLAITADATSELDVDRMVAETLEHFGRIDILINAVGGGAGKALHPAETYPRDAWDWIMELNLRSTIVPTQAVAQAMIAAGNGGRILNISSVRANLGINAGYSAYVAAKGAISSLTRQWATEWARARHPRQRDHADLRRHAPDRVAARGPGVPGGHRQPDPARARRGDARSRRPRDLPVLGRRVVRDRPGPRDRRRPHRNPVTRSAPHASCPRPRTGHAERLHDHEAARLQPELRDHVGRRRHDRHAAAAHPRRRHARRGGDARPDPLPDQHREPRRPHLRQLVVPGRGRGRQPPGALRHLHGPEGGARPIRLRARGDPDR